MAFFATLAPGAARAQANADANRVILLFVVNPPDENAKKGIIAWAQSFKINIRFLLADFLVGSSGTAPLFKVLINSQNVEDVPDQGVLETSFDHQPSLQVVSAVGQYSGKSTIVTNDIYLGNLKGSLAQPYVFVSREIQPQQYANTRDALAVVTLYAYAMALAKASQQDSSRYLICKVLDRANTYKGQDLGLTAKPYLDDLFKAISAELELRSCGGKS
jgi:hypothetical protein